MDINKHIVFYLIVSSCVLGLMYNFVNPDGISVLKEKRRLEWASDSTESFTDNPVEMSPPANIMDEAKAITLKQAYELYNHDAVFIDARDYVEFEIGRIKKSVSLPYVEFDKYKSVLDNIPKETPLVTYCDGKDCDLSIHLGDKLFEMGYKEVYIFFGGWLDWQIAGYPVESDEEM